MPKEDHARAQIERQELEDRPDWELEQSFPAEGSTQLSYGPVHPKAKGR
jgi:hypothetical protein